VKSEPADLDSITPLDFLLGVMRDAKSPAGLRLRVARMVAPYIHTKGEPRRQDQARPEMMVVDDPYGFNPEMLESLHRDVERLRALEPPQDKEFRPENYAEYRAALEKVKQTPAYLELEKSIADKFPSNKTREVLLKADRVSVVFERLPDGKIRVTTSSWDDAKVILPDQVLEVAIVGKQVALVRVDKPLAYLDIDDTGLVEAGYGPEA